MSAQSETTTNESSAFVDAVERDLKTLCPGQTHALILFRPDPAVADHAEATIRAALRANETPDEHIAVVNHGAIAVWLVRTPRTRALAQARIARFALTNAASERGPTQSPAANAVSVGIVIVSASNWTYDALLTSAKVTAAFAALSGTGAIRVADQAAPEIAGGLTLTGSS